MKKVSLVLFVTVICIGTLMLLSPVIKAEVINITVKLNNEIVDFPDAKPFMDGSDRVQVPVRFIAEKTGVGVDWNDSTRTVTLKNGLNYINIKVGERKVVINGVEMSIDTEAVIKDERLYVPVRFVCETLGLRVDWDNETFTVSLNTQPPKPVPAPVAVGGIPEPKSMIDLKDENNSNLKAMELADLKDISTKVFEIKSEMPELFAVSDGEGNISLSMAIENNNNSVFFVVEQSKNESLPTAIVMSELNTYFADILKKVLYIYFKDDYMRVYNRIAQADRPGKELTLQYQSKKYIIVNYSERSANGRAMFPDKEKQEEKP